MDMYKKLIRGRPYWYLPELARVDGKPKMASERYLGSVAEIEKLLDAKESATVPGKTRHLGFGDSAAVWGILQRLDIAGIIDEVSEPQREDAGASVGTYLALAALNRVLPPPQSSDSVNGGRAPRRTASPKSPPPSWTTASSGMPRTRSSWSRWSSSKNASRWLWSPGSTSTSQPWPWT